MDFFEVLTFVFVFIGVLEFGFLFLDTSGIQDKLKAYFGVNQPIKFLFKLFNCDFCLSFWIGVIVFCLMFIPNSTLYFVAISSIGWFWVFNRLRK